MVIALVVEHVFSSQTMLQLDRTANLQGDVILFFLPQRPILDINTKKIQITCEQNL